MVFFMSLAFLIFDPNWPFCKGYGLCLGCSLCNIADFQNCLIFRMFGVFFFFFLRFFAQCNSNVIVKLAFLFLTQTDHFARTIAFPWAIAFAWCDFQNCLISRIFGVFLALFAQNNCSLFVECFFACLWHFSFLIWTEHFAKTIAFVWAGPFCVAARRFFKVF